MTERKPAKPALFSRPMPILIFIVLAVLIDQVVKFAVERYLPLAPRISSARDNGGKISGPRLDQSAACRLNLFLRNRNVGILRPGDLYRLLHRVARRRVGHGSNR